MSDKNTLSASLLYVGRQNFDNDLTSTFGRKMPSYTVVDVKFNHCEGAWLLSAAVNNLLNTQYITYGVASTATAGRYNAYPMQQRNLSFVATYQF
jgi:iron complex outermembrane receptor protein